MWWGRKANPPKKKAKKDGKGRTYNSGYSLVVTHPTTNPPISSLCMAERTGCPVLLSLWSYVTVILMGEHKYHLQIAKLHGKK
jgi:hypothetical protein